MQFNTEEIGWPHDTVILRYQNVSVLQRTVFDLWSCEQVFVVSPKNSSIAMSRVAAEMIGVL